MATASPVSSSLSHKGGSLDTASSKLRHTTSPRKLRRLQSAYTDEEHSESKCKLCGWHYPNQSPNSRQRRYHKKICPKRASLGSDEEIETSGGHGVPERSESESSTETSDHELRHTAYSRKMLSSDKEEAEEVKEREEAQNETEKGVADKVEQGSSKVLENGEDDKLLQGSSKMPIYSRHKDSGTGEEVLASLKQTDLGSRHISEEEPQAGHFPRNEFDEEIGSDSGVSSAAGEHETDPSDYMEFDSSDTAEVAKREDILPSDEELVDREKKYRALQHQHPHTLLKGDSENSHRPESEDEGKPVNVAKLITIYDKGKGISASLPSNVTNDNMGLAGVEPSNSSLKVGGSGQLPSRSKDHKYGGEIIPAKEIVEGRLSTALGTEDDLEMILRTQKTHNLICPNCGSEISNRIILRKKRRTFVGKSDAAQLPNLTEISSEVSDHDHTGKAFTAMDRGTWLERCFGYFDLFRR